MKSVKMLASVETLLILLLTALTISIVAIIIEKQTELFQFSVPLKAEVEPTVGYAIQGKQIFRVACADCHILIDNDVKQQTKLRGYLLRKDQGQMHSVSQFWDSTIDLFISIKAAAREHSNAFVSEDEAYDLTAYILHMNGLISEDQPVNLEWLKANHPFDGKGFGTKWVR